MSGTAKIQYAKHPLDIADLVAFWDFQEEPGNSRVSQGPNRYRLREQNGPVNRVEDGLFGLYAAHFEVGQWLNLPRQECPELNFHGPQAQVTVAAWVKWGDQRRCQAVAGMWNETRKKRQYALFLNLSGRYGSLHNAHGHVSAVGGPTPGEPYCVTYSTGATQVPLGEWCFLAMTYDGKASRVYLDGQLDTRGRYNPYLYEGGLFDGGTDGSDFTVASVDAAGGMSNFFAGSIAGLAVFKRALSPEEIDAIGRRL